MTAMQLVGLSLALLIMFFGVVLFAFGVAKRHADRQSTSYRPATSTPYPKLPQGGSGTASRSKACASTELLSTVYVSAMSDASMGEVVNAAGVPRLLDPPPADLVVTRLATRRDGVWGWCVDVTYGRRPRCTKAPAGWQCRRLPGHDGPCAAERQG